GGRRIQRENERQRRFGGERLRGPILIAVGNNSQLPWQFILGEGQFEKPVAPAHCFAGEPSEFSVEVPVRVAVSGRRPKIPNPESPRRINDSPINIQRVAELDRMFLTVRLHSHVPRVTEAVFASDHFYLDVVRSVSPFYAS